MKSKLIGVITACALSMGAANAVVLQTNIFANTSNNIGLVTTTISGSLATVTGLAFLYSSATQIAGTAATSVTTRAGFEALIGADPGAVRSNLALTNGALSSVGTTELGAVGNNLYLWLQSTDGLTYGLYQAADVPSLGTVSVTSASTTDWVGTSAFAGTAGVASGPTTATGFQLASVPEPSAALLGAIGALGLLRRRRN